MQTVRMMVPAVFQSRTGRQTRVDRQGLQRKLSIRVPDSEKLRLVEELSGVLL